MPTSNDLMHIHTTRYFCSPQNHLTNKAQFPWHFCCTSPPNSSHKVINQMSSHISPPLPTLPLPSPPHTFSPYSLLRNMWAKEHTDPSPCHHQTKSSKPAVFAFCWSQSHALGSILCWLAQNILASKDLPLSPVSPS